MFYSYIGRGGSDGCAVPMNVERLNTLDVVQVECGAQFSLALTRDGEVRKFQFFYLPFDHISIIRYYRN